MLHRDPKPPRARGGTGFVEIASMRGFWRWLSVLAALVMGGAAVVWVLGQGGARVQDESGANLEPEPIVEVARTVRYRFVVTNETTAPLEGAELWAYAPLARTGTQRVERLEASAGYVNIAGPTGGDAMRIRIDRLPPKGSRVVSITAHLGMARTPNRLPDAQASHLAYLEPEPGIESRAPEIVGLARELRGADGQDTARRVYAWVADNVRYAGYLREARGALYALNKREGDCTESAMLFAALARANGIPARVLGGYIAKRDTLLGAGDYHNWAEFLTDGRWHLADPQRRVFMEGYEDYVSFHVLGVPSDAGPVGKGRFGSSTEGVRVTMH